MSIETEDTQVVTRIILNRLHSIWVERDTQSGEDNIEQHLFFVSSVLNKNLNFIKQKQRLCLFDLSYF